VRPAAFGWFLLVYGALCILATAWNVFEHGRNVRFARQVSAVVDSLAVLQCVPVKAGSDVRIFPPRRDTLPRAVR